MGNDIMRKSQIKRIKESNIVKDDDEDEDAFVAKKVMRFATVPSQNVIGMKKKQTQKPKFKFFKNKTISLGKRNNFIVDKDDDVNENDKQPPSKKRKIYK